jgi:hypothetical protein
MGYAENQYMGGPKARLWTYLIMMVALVVGAVAINFAIKNPDLAEKGIESFLGMPRWAFPVLGILVGILVYWAGLKIETDWPEALGALLIAGSVAALELLVGWKKFALGGLIVLPYAIPALIFGILMMNGIMKSR